MELDRGPLTDEQLLAICEQKVGDATKFYTTEISRQRSLAENYYYGRPFGTEVEGSSQVVIRDVAEAIDSLMPELMEVFAGAERICVFNPRTPADVPLAEQATDYVNWVWDTQRPVPGFLILFTWFKDALLNKVGIIKIWWDERAEWRAETYEGLTQEQAVALAADQDIEIVNVFKEPEGASATMPALSAPGGSSVPGMEAAPPTFTVNVRRNYFAGRVRIANVPPDEFFIDRNAVSIDEAPAVGQRSKKTVTELIEEGFDREVVLSIGKGDDDPELSPERTSRFVDEGAAGALLRQEADEASREIWVTEIYLRVDYDGDGLAELRQVIYAGKVILSNVEVDNHPYCDLCPNPMPHRFYGESIADKTMDLQLIKSTIVRQMLDNLYRANNPEKEVLEGAVNIDDLLISRPGGIKRVRVPNAIREIVTPFVAQQSFPMLEYFDQQREMRTGVLRYNQGLDPDALNKTASGIMRMMDAGQRRVRLIARIFAETGLRRAFRRIFELTIKHQRGKQVMRLRDQFVPVDPANWHEDWDISVTVGLGTGNREMLFQQMLALVQLDMTIAQMQGGFHGPLVNATTFGEKLAKLAELTGLRLAERYYPKVPPEANQPPPQQPSPEMLKVQAQIEAEKAKTQAEMQLKMMELQADIERKRMEMEATLAMKRERNLLEMQLRREEHAQAMQLKQAELMAEVALKDKEIVQKGKARDGLKKPDGNSDV